MLDVTPGSTNEDALAAMDFDAEGMLDELRRRHVDRATSLGQQWALDLLRAYPYLTRL